MDPAHALPRCAFALGLLFTLFAGCLPSTELPAARDAGSDTAPPEPEPPAVRDVSVVDSDGVSYPRDAIPLRPVIAVLSTSTLSGDVEPIMLLQGEVDGALLDDLDGAPLRASTRARLVSSRVERSAAGALLTPDAVLDPGANYVMAVGGWAGGDEKIGLAFAVDMRTAVHGGGARLRGSWPADGTEGVPRALPFAAVRFDEPVRGLPGGVRLLDSSGGVVPSSSRVVSCADLGWPDGECARLDPVDPLWAGRDHRIEITEDVRDMGGSPVGPAQVHFRTALGDFSTPELHAPACALDEQPWPAPEADGTGDALACVLADDHGLRFRLSASGALRYGLTSARASDSVVAARGDASLALEGLTPDTRYTLELRTVDLAGQETRRALEWSTTPPLAQVFVMEVRADPRGSEPMQEYVELYNGGSTVVDLGGFALSDSSTREGDLFPSPAPLGPGERILVVADAFDPADARDRPAPPGARLLRVGTSLGSGGLSNSGEALFLRDELGRRLSGAPAAASAGPGACLQRVSRDGRRTNAEAFIFVEPCTPGAPAATR